MWQSGDVRATGVRGAEPQLNMLALRRLFAPWRAERVPLVRTVETPSHSDREGLGVWESVVSRR